MTQFYVTPLTHPSTIRGGQWARGPAQQTYLSRLVAREKQGLDPVDWDTSKPPPGSYLYPSLAQLDEWWDLFKEGPYDAISHDLETAGQYIICDGLTPLCVATGELGPSLCLHFRGHNGVRWWRTYGDHYRAVCWLGKVLADPAVAFVGHNVISFDLPFLAANDLPVAGPALDTMVLMSRAWPEIPKGLQFTATLLLGAPAWKRMVKAEDDGAEKT